jgi:hypothetical protein
MVHFKCILVVQTGFSCTAELEAHPAATVMILRLSLVHDDVNGLAGDEASRSGRSRCIFEFISQSSTFKVA